MVRASFRQVLLTLGVVLSTTLSLPALAQGGHGGGGHFGGGHFGGGHAAGGFRQGHWGGGGAWRGGGWRGGGWRGGDWRGGWRGGWGDGWRGGWGEGWGWGGFGLGLGLGYGAWGWNDPLLYDPYPWGYAAYPAAPAVVVSQPVSPQDTTYLGNDASTGQGMAPAGPSQWFYCDSAKGYYPYVKQCPEPWHAVPSTPPGAVQP